MAPPPIRRDLSVPEARPPFAREVPVAEFHLYESEARLADQFYQSGFADTIAAGKSIWVLPASSTRHFTNYQAFLKKGRIDPGKETAVELSGGFVQRMIVKHSGGDGEFDYEEIKAAVQDTDFWGIAETDPNFAHYVDLTSWHIRGHIGMIIYANPAPVEKKLWRDPVIIAGGLTLLLALPFAVRNLWWLGRCAVRWMRQEDELAKIVFPKTPWFFFSKWNFVNGLSIPPLVFSALMGTEWLHHSKPDDLPGWLRPVQSRLSSNGKSFLEKVGDQVDTMVGYFTSAPGEEQS